MARPARADASTATKSKSDFILEHPDKPAKDVVAIAKSLGIVLTQGYIHTARSLARSRKRHAEMRAEMRAAVHTRGEAGNAGSILLALAGEVGLGRAIEMLENERQRVLAMLK